jgi:hypothetical protein
MQQARGPKRVKHISLEQLVRTIQNLPDDDLAAVFRAVHTISAERITSPTTTCRSKEEARVSRLRWRLARELDLLPQYAAYALLGELLVFVHLDGATTVAEFDAALRVIRDQFLYCKGEVETAH